MLFVVSGALGGAGLAATADAASPKANLHIGGAALSWPIAESHVEVAAGTVLTVRVYSSRRPVHVSLTRTSGQPRVVATRTLRRGTIRVRVPAAGKRYRLRVTSAGEHREARLRSVVPKACGSGDSGLRLLGRLRLPEKTAYANDRLEATVTNDSAFCLLSGLSVMWERELPDGSFEAVTPAAPVPAALRYVEPATPLPISVWVYDTLEPGQYRASLRLDALSGRTVTLTARLSVLGR